MTNIRNERSTLKQQSVLLKQARIALDVRYIRDVVPALEPFKQASADYLGGGILSHYRGGSGGITWCGKDARDCFVNFNADEFRYSPVEFVQRILEPYSNWRRD